MGERVRRARLVRRLARQRVLATLAVLALAAAVPVGMTFSAFSNTTSDSANSTAAGTVTITDNDANGAMFSTSGMIPGSTASACIKVTYTGTLPSLVGMYATTTGSGLGTYLDLTVTRGTISSGSFSACTGFSADATDYLGSGAGVVYSGTLASYPSTYAAGISDPRTASIPEAWTTNEVHSYKFTVTLQNNPSAANKTASTTFNWESRNTAAYSQVVLSDQPSSYWKLDEAAGTSAADSAGSVTGTYTNGPTLNQASGVKDANAAVGFDGSNDFITAGDNYDFAGTAAMTVELWLKPTAATTSYRRVISKEAAGGWDLYMEASSGGSPNAISFERSDAAGVSDYVGISTALPTTSWTYVVYTYDGTNMRFYIDGVLRQTTASSRSVQNHANPLTIGRYSSGVDYFGGLLDEVAIYSSALSGTQVAEHFAAGDK
jgi:hypothetical protein